MTKRLRTVGVAVALIGAGFVVAGAVAFARVQAGYDSLQSFSEAQNVTLAYDDQGRLVDRGSPEGAEAILSLLTDDWGYPVDMADLIERTPSLSGQLARLEGDDMERLQPL